MTPLETVQRLYPWNVTPRFAEHPLNKIMREHGDYVATGGRGMSGEVLYRLETFYHKLHSENLVVEYDPASGFHYRARRDSDRGLIIRPNEHTRLEEHSHLVWRFPSRLPTEKPTPTPRTERQ